MFLWRLLPVILLVVATLAVEFTQDEHYKRDFRMRKKVCLKKSDYGKCKGHRQMWYFNVYRMRCETFIYSNCGGNRNRFFNEEDCVEFCGRHDWSKVAPELRG